MIADDGNRYALAQRTGVAGSTATRMVQRLERMGLVRCAEDAAADRRRRYTALTDAGRDVARQAHQVLVDRMRMLLAPLLPSDRRRDIVAGMEALIEALQLADRPAAGRTSTSASDGEDGDSRDRRRVRA